MPTDLFTNFAAGKLTADPGAAGTILNSANFAYLPVVAAPNQLRISLDPDGVVGQPEIALVTAHTLNATQVTVARGQETQYGAGPARAHPIDTVWRHTFTALSVINMMVPAGTIRPTIAQAADAGYLMMDGTAVANAQTLYPYLWAVAPAAWKAGSTLNLPNMSGRVLYGTESVGALGTTRDANTRALVEANLPAHAHLIDPPNTGISVDPPNTAVTGSVGDSPTLAHSHVVNAAVSSFNTYCQPSDASGVMVQPKLNGGASNLNPSPYLVHQHPAGTLAVDIPAFTAYCDIAAFWSGNGNGTGTAFDVRQAAISVNFQIKAH